MSTRPLLIGRCEEKLSFTSELALGDEAPPHEASPSSAAAPSPRPPRRGAAPPRLKRARRRTGSAGATAAHVDVFIDRALTSGAPSCKDPCSHGGGRAYHPRRARKAALRPAPGPAHPRPGGGPGGRRPDLESSRRRPRPERGGGLTSPPHARAPHRPGLRDH